MTAAGDFNAGVIDNFRASDGVMTGQFAGYPIVLVHHVGRRSGRSAITPLVYWADDDSKNSLYIFASANGAAQHPAWYFNLTSAGEARVELGAETFEVGVRELAGDERERVYAANAKEQPQFLEYEERAGSRTIPVLALTRTA